ncbi:MAG: Crp/Fnr family transcriptional regulator [Terriglobales bacterium]
MADPQRQELLSIMQGAQNRLEYLTANDWALIIDKVVRQSFAKGDELLQFGKKNTNILFIVKGSASVVSARRWQIASVRAGEVLGEMAFLEGSNASATVVADEAVEVYAVSWQALDSLFELYPHMGSRFYRSVAVSLSRRLRKQISE